jgi:hypothetical protein
MTTLCHKFFNHLLLGIKTMALKYKSLIFIAGILGVKENMISLSEEIFSYIAQKLKLEHLPK